MKRIMQRSYFVLIVALAFFVGIGFVTYKIVANSSTWVQSSRNPHLPSVGNLSEAGDILDRNGAVLAHTEGGKRAYHEDADVRRALLHAVGDGSMNISTSIQSMYRADLSGYSFWLGMGLPASIKGNSSLHLTVDADACKAAYEAMDGCKGACIVYNYKTGEVLCSVSTPTYDPADPPKITKDNESEYDGVYLDNVLSSTYIPGSTFKVITAASAIENIPDIEKRTFTCTGTYEVLGKSITCEEEHGELSFKDAIAQSCNCAVAQIAIEIGDKKLKKTAEEFRFNLGGLSMSGIPLAKSTYDAVGAGDNYLAWSGIGQYTDLANPAHMAMIAAAIANRGTAVSPYIIEEEGSLLNKVGITNKKAGDVQMIDAPVADRVKDIMHTAFEHYGVSVAGLDRVCAKTGTAEIGQDEDGYGKTNAWFFGFIDDERYPYAFAVVREVVKYDEYASDESYGRASAAVIDAAVSALINKTAS